MNPREKVPLGEDHVWLELEEAERVEPGSMAVATVAARKRVRNKNWILRNMFSDVSIIVCVCSYGYVSECNIKMLDVKDVFFLGVWFVGKKWEL